MTDHDFTLKTARLVLRPVSPGDVTALHEVWTSAGGRQYLWDDEIIPLDRTRAVVEQSEAAFAERRAGLWVGWSAEAPGLIGYGALWRFRETHDLELLYGVAEPFWGRGYAAEIGQAVVDYCFDALAMAMVNASTDVDNVRSIRVLEKLGFTCVRRSKVEGLDTVFYELARRWTSRQN